MRLLALASVIAIGLAVAGACTDEGAGPTDPAQAAATPGAPPADGQTAQVAPAGPPSVELTINWDAARADLSKRPAGTEGFQVQAVGKDGPPPVPMLLPSGVVTAQGAGDRPTAPVITGDGYFATYHLPKYDAIVNGSNKAYQIPGQAAGDKTVMKFTKGEATASLTFSRYGANYTIDFECRQVDGGDSCITEAEAKEFADSLFVAQTQ